MFDFVNIKSKRDDKKKTISVYPSFLVRKSKDLMTKGKSFYAIWDEEAGLWSEEETRACELIDREIDLKAEELKEARPDYDVHTMKLLDYKSRQFAEWQSYCKAIPDNFKFLDSDVTFINDNVRKEDYRSKRLEYAMDNVDIPNYDELMSTLYSEEERQKIEWAIGSVIAGDSKDIQKFYVFYGEPGSGKSTVLKIIKKLFEGYCTTFDARAIGNANSAFALEPFKNNPLIAIQDDGDLSRIDSNERLNSIASHEYLVINEKHKSTYSARFNTIMFIGTNKPVRITDAKSGIIRRLIDISPTGITLKRKRYDAIMDQLDFELSGIANHCYEVYKELGKRYYDTYKPMNMIGITNDFYNFVDDNLDFFIEHKDYVQLKRAWQMYKDYVVDANVQYPFQKKAFKEELKNYFAEFHERTNGERNVYIGFQFDIFDYKFEKEPEDTTTYSLTFDETESIFDKLYPDAPAQYANKDGKPLKKWENVTTTLKDIDTHKLHYVLMGGYPIICIDFDIKNEKGEKDFELNLAAASKWPATYAELSKSGGGIHLYYIYEGDVSQLSHMHDEDIEVKVFTGNSSLRRMVTKCNNLPIAKISSGLKLKGDKPMVNLEAMKNEKQLRALIKNCLLKKHHGATTPEVYYIHDTLEKCYNQGMHYDVTDMRPDITAFAANSNNQSLQCLKLVADMKFKSEEPSDSIDDEEAPIIFYDVEVFPNLFIICWKYQGDNKTVVRMINPTPEDVEKLFRFRLVGYNNRRYDNHIIYARSLGYSNEELFTLSSRIVAGDKKEENRNCFFAEAYNLSYTDIYDYSSKKQSLKKWEIELGIHHVENEYAWDQPVDESHWEEIADYCCNDVIATEKVFNETEADFKARLILAELSGLTANDTTNSHTTRLIVGKDKNPQEKFIYTDLSKEFKGYRYDSKGIPKEEYKDESQIVNGKSIYMGEDPSEGGYVYAEPGMYFNVALLDIASLHPSSAIILKVFGEEYTANFAMIKQIRIHIKHKEYDKVREMFDGKLAKYLTSDEDAKALSFALKIAINSVYGLTSAKFPNKLRDPRNVDNIVAKRGALFMITLKNEVQKRGFTVAHVKTDSIKIPNATQEIIDFVMEFGKKYGYDFEHEATYEKMCLVNDAVYIAKYADGDHEFELSTGEKVMTPWTATGTEFQIPYIFKTVFADKPLQFRDYCETKSVTKGALYLDMNENLPEDEHNYKFVGRVGEFVPITPGEGGGILYRVADDKYYAATGTKGYRWLDSETVKAAGYESHIDKSYFDKLVDNAVDHIKEYGDFEWFVSDDKTIPFDASKGITDDNRVELPWDESFTAMNPPA
ncbi:DUF5906 domain-containing protein [Butyrivibrio sp. INlla21]|uniref:DUF5906 domain-containing protein n=1 Tax=Butyrivibrio sp. INlla21 TaxID=1520811 RepID=UPI0008ED3478|nr:DUF5906 domain-containing protein [Butyrivibrio sp. INlla21]SFU32995.1 hypothetical protein SAMN02910342_00102 [Butyrivibrio sp. INlla21]